MRGDGVILRVNGCAIPDAQGLFPPAVPVPCYAEAQRLVAHYIALGQWCDALAWYDLLGLDHGLTTWRIEQRWAKERRKELKEQRNVTTQNVETVTFGRPKSQRPRLLDLFCGAGGAAVGYHRAGFDVVGVDIVDQPHYPYTFHNADALTYPLDGFDAIHASPPCQEHSTLRTKTTQRGKAYLLNATLERLASVSVPWIVENVVGTSVEMNGWYVTLCGTTFGLGVRRHRRFGSNVLLLTAECTHYLQPEPIDVTGGGPSHTVRTTVGGRSRKAGIAKARQAMGIDWPMTRAELAQAIPPAYTEYLGAQLLQYVKA